MDGRVKPKFYVGEVGFVKVPSSMWASHVHMHKRDALLKEEEDKSVKKPDLTAVQIETLFPFSLWTGARDCGGRGS